MKPPRKRRSVFDLFGGMQEAFGDILYEQPKAWLLLARERVSDLPKTNFDLGCKFADEKKWYDALFRFRIALYLQPNYPQAKYNLGCCFYHLGKIDRASDTLKQVLRETPGHRDALFMLSAIDPTAVPQALRPQNMPRDMVTGFFTSIAPDYNAIETENQYRGGVAVAEVVKPLLKTPAMSVVDLGCGSGIAAMPFRPEATELVGIDVTPAMVRLGVEATLGDKKLYDRVIEADITALGEVVPAEMADLVLMVNVAQFVGALASVLPQAARLLKPGALLAFTTETYNGPDGFGLTSETGRFGHGAAYVKQAATAAGLTLVKESKIALYAQMQTDLYVFSKGSR